MLKLLLDMLWHVDDPPDRIGVVGLAILTIFVAFAACVWFNHPSPQMH